MYYIQVVRIITLCSLRGQRLFLSLTQPTTREVFMWELFHADSLILVNVWNTTDAKEAENAWKGTLFTYPLHPSRVSNNRVFEMNAL